MTSSRFPAAPKAPDSLVRVSMLMDPGSATPRPPRATPSTMGLETGDASSEGVWMSGLRRLTVSSSSFWQILPRAEGMLVRNGASLVWAATHSMLERSAGWHWRGLLGCRNDRLRNTKPRT